MYNVVKGNDITVEWTLSRKVEGVDSLVDLSVFEDIEVEVLMQYQRYCIKPFVVNFNTLKFQVLGVHQRLGTVKFVATWDSNRSRATLYEGLNIVPTGAAEVAQDGLVVRLSSYLGDYTKSEVSYNELQNLPSINGTVVQGDMSADDLGLVEKVEGKTLSDVNFTESLKQKVESSVTTDNLAKAIKDVTVILKKYVDDNNRTDSVAIDTANKAISGLSELSKEVESLRKILGDSSVSEAQLKEVADRVTAIETLVKDTISPALEDFDKEVESLKSEVNDNKSSIAEIEDFIGETPIDQIVSDFYVSINTLTSALAAQMLDLKKVASGVDEVKNSVVEVKKSIASLSDSVDEKVQSLKTDMTGLADTIGTVSSDVAKLNENVGELNLNEEFNNIKASVVNNYNSLKGLSDKTMSRVDEIDERVVKLESINSIVIAVDPIPLYKNGVSSRVQVTWKIFFNGEEVVPDVQIANGTVVESSLYEGNFDKTTIITLSVTYKGKTMSKDVNILFVDATDVVIIKSGEIVSSSQVLWKGLGVELRNINLSNAQIRLVIPYSVGKPSSIKDINGFECINSYTYETGVNSDGVSSHIYTLTHPITINNLTQIIL